MSKPLVTLAALMLVTFVLGSVHAFSVFLAPLELKLGLPRAYISLVYSFALVAITLSVTCGYLIYAALPAWWLIAVITLCASLGLALAALAVNWWMLFVGYSLAFGVSNGIGYGFSLQLAGRAMPNSRGFAMGAVTAAYALGSILFAQIIAWRIGTDSVGSAFAAIALAVLVLGIVAALALRYSRASFGVAVPVGAEGRPRLDRVRLWQFWFAYLTAVFAGLMAIGHAAAIAQARGAEVELATWSAMTVGIGSALGGFAAGWLVDRWPQANFLAGLPLLSALALLAMASGGDAVLTLWLLGLVGFSYGSIIAIYPVVIADVFGEQGPRAYGRVFIAWGFAGLAAPWSAGILYDVTGGYRSALIIAALVALLSCASSAAFRLGKPC